MAKIGLKYPVAAKYGDGGYTGGTMLGKAISASAKINISEAKLYADDALAESVKEFTGGTLTLGLDEISDEIAVLLFGHTKGEADGSEPAELTASADDSAPYVGVGFYGKSIKSGTATYRAIWYPKVQFKEPEEAMSTKAESTTFSTYSIEGDLMRDETGAWRKSAGFKTEAEAVAWLQRKAGITV